MKRLIGLAIPLVLGISAPAAGSASPSAATVSGQILTPSGIACTPMFIAVPDNFAGQVATVWFAVSTSNGLTCSGTPTSGSVTLSYY
ncbi:MAG: hypothetical protein ACYDAY_07955 [Candidatus Dormibacteria bacterium]